MNLPKSYDEITMRQFQALHAAKSDYEIVAAFVGGDVSEIEEPNLDDMVFGEIAEWYFKEFDWEAVPRPEKITVLGVEVSIPKDLSLETFGQKVLAEQAMIENRGRDVISLSCKVVAIYLQKRVFPGKIDEARIDELEKALLDMPAIQIYPIASFFLQKLIASLRTKMTNFVAKTMPTISKPVLEALRNSEL